MTTPHAAAATLPPRIGCAGWSIATAQQPLFDAAASLLQRYATRFNAVEINSSFYRPHRTRTYARWAAAVPMDFRFAVKMPKAISHQAGLRQCGPLLDAFMGEVLGLDDKLGCLLLQLPPSLAFEPRLAAGFFGMLRRRWSGAVVCEPRHASWFDPAVDELWQRYRIARVGADPARQPGAGQPAGDTSVRYWRLHGSPRIYYSAYDDDTLHALAARVGARGSANAWVVFDNTAQGHALLDALRLRHLLQANPPCRA